jgi:hypothetical protein
MSVARAALVALLVGLTLLVSPAVLLQFQDPTECTNDVDRLEDGEERGDLPVRQYDDLSPTAKRAFDRARTADRSVTVTGERCPVAFDYGVDQSRYVVVEDDTRYLLTTYANDLVPETQLAAAVVAFLGLVVLGTGVAAYDDHDARGPAWLGAVGAATLAVVTAAVVLRERRLAAVGGALAVTAAALVGAGAVLRPRRALLLGGGLAVLPAAVAAPFVGASAVVLAPAVLPPLLVGIGVGGRRLVARS